MRMSVRKEKKYASIFEVQERLSFKGGPDLSQKIDEILSEMVKSLGKSGSESALTSIIFVHSYSLTYSSLLT